MAEAEKKQVQVTILGQSFPLVTTGDPAATESLAAEVDDLMHSIASRSRNLDSTRVAILASLHLADRLRTTEAELKSITGHVQDKAKQLGELLDQLNA
jgi:cell division protein ZapA (FtsZ GTPase activity inhibitor)